jgi:formiminotetrahydrofolate cyclodeaminase
MAHDVTIEGFLDDLAAGAPVPGGGAAAALAVATGAALAAMVCRLTLGREKYREHREAMDAALEAAEELRSQARKLIAEDVAAYTAVTEAYRLPQGTDEERAARAGRVEEALKGATEVPLRTAALAAQVIEFCAAIADSANPNALGDLAVGVLSARTALEGSAINVRINLGLIRDDTFKTTRAEQLQRHLDAARPLSDRVVQHGMARSGR